MLTIVSGDNQVIGTDQPLGPVTVKLVDGPTGKPLVNWTGILATAYGLGGRKFTTDASGLATVVSGPGPLTTLIGSYKGTINCTRCGFTIVPLMYRVADAREPPCTVAVTQAYGDILGRKPDADGLKVWVGICVGGQATAAMRVSMAGSEEARGYCIAQLKSEMNAFFGAEPNDGALGYWVPLCQKTMAAQSKAAAFAEMHNGIANSEPAKRWAGCTTSVTKAPPQANLWASSGSGRRPRA